MSCAADQPIFERLRCALASRAAVRVALVVGSRARGTEHAASDLDLAVDGADVDLLALAAELTVALGLTVDTASLALADASIPLLEEVLRDGVLVHENAPGAGAAWRFRTLLALETDRPWYASMRDAYLRRVATRGLGDGQS